MSVPTRSFHAIALKAEELNLFRRKLGGKRFSSKFERGGTLPVNCRCPVINGLQMGREGNECNAMSDR
jgi:hypothetical protein